MPFTTTKPVGQFTDINGKPLDGQVFFGQPNLDPIANPITVYWDAAGTQPVTQPVVTVGGYPMNGSTRSNVFVNADYSILVRNRNGFTVFSAPNLPFEDSSDNQYFLQAGSGAVQRTVQSKLRDVVSVKDFGAVGDGVTDDTVAIQNALNSANNIYFPTPSSAYLVTSINIPAGRTIRTESVAVKFQQKSGQPTGTRVFTVMGPNVTIGDMTIEGNIATDTGEFNHAIAVATDWSGVALSNVSIGNIKAINIRGDGVYIGQLLANGRVSNVRVSSVDGTNVLRNVVSVVGGSDVEIGQVTGSAVGYMHVDVEPDSALTGGCTNIYVGQVKGRHIGIVANSASINTINQNIWFGEVWLDPAFATQSTPAYSPGATIAPRGVHLRNVRSAHIGSLRVNGFDSSAVWSTGGGIGIESVVIDQCVLTDCAKNDATNYSYIACANITIKYLYAVTQAASSNQRIIQSNNNVVLSGNITLGNNASVVRSATNCTLQNCVISGPGATNTYAALSADNTVLKNCTISNVERLAGFLNGITLDSCVATLSVAVFSTVTKAVYVRSTVQSQYYGFATGRRDYTEAIAFGTQFLWVDATGTLRIKSGAPTSDTDGTVVGTQT